MAAVPSLCALREFAGVVAHQIAVGKLWAAPWPPALSRLPFELFLALRYLRPKCTFVSVITLISAVGLPY